MRELAATVLGGRWCGRSGLIPALREVTRSLRMRGDHGQGLAAVDAPSGAAGEACWDGEQHRSLLRIAVRGVDGR